MCKALLNGSMSFLYFFFSSLIVLLWIMEKEGAKFVGRCWYVFTFAFVSMCRSFFPYDLDLFFINIVCLAQATSFAWWFRSIGLFFFNTSSGCFPFLPVQHALDFCYYNSALRLQFSIHINRLALTTKHVSKSWSNLFPAIRIQQFWALNSAIVGAWNVNTRRLFAFALWKRCAWCFKLIWFLNKYIVFHMLASNILFSITIGFKDCCTPVLNSICKPIALLSVTCIRIAIFKKTHLFAIFYFSHCILCIIAFLAYFFGESRSLQKYWKTWELI